VIEPGAYTLVFKPDRTNSDWYYLESTAADWSDTFERTINLPRPDPKSPLEIAAFVPRSSYPFPDNATLVRGKVTRGVTNVEGVIVSTTYQHEDPPGTPSSPVSVRTLTDREGEFVLFFKRLPGKTQSITLTAAEGLIQAPPQTVPITEGTTRKDVLFNLP
jgi:hypothetical protein